MAKSVGVIGLGAMGIGMARSLLRGGFSVRGYDPSNIATAHAKAAGVEIVASALQVIKGSEVTVLSLPLARHVEEVVRDSLAGDAFGGQLKRVVVDTSTSEAAVSRKLAARLAEAGHGFLDAPVSGGPQGAAAGTLSMMVGGDTVWLTHAMPVLQEMAANVVHVGDSGAGNIAKLVNNMLVACHMLTTVEGLRLADAAGLPAEDALKVINSATGRSALSEIHFPKWVLTNSFNSGFSAGLMRKDIRLALGLAAEVGCTMPVAELAADLWSEARSGVTDKDDFMLLGDIRASHKEKADG